MTTIAAQKRATIMSASETLPASIIQNIECVVRIAKHMDELRNSVEEKLLSTAVRDRGYFLPSEEDEALAIWGSYQHSRAALREVIESLQHAYDHKEKTGLAEFLIGYSAATLLVEAARFLRDFLAKEPTIRSKLNEAQPYLQIEQGSFELIQRSLTSPSNALQIRKARDFFESNQKEFENYSDQNSSLTPILRLIQDRRASLDVSTSRYVKGRLRDRQQQITDGLLQKGIASAIYSLQQICAVAIGSLSTSPSHRPKLPDSIAEEMSKIIRQGDILITRKENALTNYFLPGFWPHGALAVGNGRVVEALKDGVRNRTLESTFDNDAMIVIRSKLNHEKIEHVIQRALSHVGKPYDFDFDFTRSDRMVCTEVIYRSFSGITDIQFNLTKRAGRHTLSAEDLLGLAINESSFQIIAAYHPAASPWLLLDQKARQLAQQSIGKKQVDWDTAKSNYDAKSRS